MDSYGEEEVTAESNILLLTMDENTAKTVQATLLDNHGMALAGICKDISEIKPHLSNNNIQVVVVDIDHDPSHLLYELSELSHSFPDIYIVVISESFHRDFVLRAMQAGARHFLEKKNITNELSDVLLHLDKTSKRKKRLSGSSGSVISVFSAGGGCGATTVTVNLASELRLLSSQKILVIDLDNCYGTISTYMGIKSRYGIADVMNRTGLIDKHLIQSSAFNYMEDFHVLVSPVGLDSPKVISLEYKNLPRVLESCRELYEYTVIDASHLSSQEMIDLAGLSDILLIVFQLTVKDVNVARRIVVSLSQAGIDSQKIMLLVNRFKKRGPFVRLEDTKKVIGLDSFQIIRSDWKTAMKSINHGQPLNQVAKGSGLRNDFRKLATKIQARQFNGGSKSQGD